MIFRSVDLKEAEAYQQLINRAYQSTQELGINFAAATATLADVEVHLKTNGVYAIEIDGVLASTLSLRFPWGNNPGPYGLPHIGWLATAINFKRQGLSLKLIEWVAQNILIHQLKVPAVTLGTAQNHPWLIEFYEKIGFKIIGSKDLGRGHLTIYMEKILQEEIYLLWKSKEEI